MNKLIILQRFIKKINNDDIFGLSAQFSYYIIVSVFPFILVLVLFLGMYSDFFFEAMKEIKSIIPNQVYLLLTDIASNSQVNYKASYFSIGLIILIWSASSGSVGIIKGLNKAYNCTNKRNYILTRITGIIFIMGIILCLYLALIFIVIGKNVVTIIKSVIVIPEIILLFINIIRYILPLAFIIIIFSLSYKFLPFVKIKFKSVLLGAIIAAIGWAISSAVFSLYINYKGTYYNNIYGNLSGIFISVLWIYMSSFIFLLGGEINAFMVQENISAKKILLK